jgi:Flp pilus assembly protein TadD
MFVQATLKARDNARAWSNLGALYYLQRKFDDAERALERAISSYDYGPALSNLATIKFRIRRNYAEAATLFERAAQVAPRDYRILKNLASAYYWAEGQRTRALELLERAIAVLEEARQIEPNDPELLANLGDMYAMKGDAVRSREAIARAVALAPSQGNVPYLAAAVHETLGDRDQALAHLAAAFAAGLDRFQIESDPAFVELTKDRRYSTLASSGNRK